MIKNDLAGLIEKALQTAVDGDVFAAPVNPTRVVPVLITRPKVAEHGDFASDLPFKLARQAKMDPQRIAGLIVAQLEKEGSATKPMVIETAGKGYINFRLAPAWYTPVLQAVHTQGGNFGRSEFGKGKRVMIEYVSANPTGDLHIGHGRIAVLGSCLSKVMQFAGFDVGQEFYINDAGEQIAHLGRCAWAIYQKLNGKLVQYPDGGYPEHSLLAYVAEVYAAVHGQYLSLSDDDGAKRLGELTRAVIIEHQKAVLARARVEFDQWYSESALHDAGKVDMALAQLAAKQLTSTADGALIFKSQTLGDARDRFLTRQNGSKTYLAADIAYHMDKLDRGHDLLINIWGADHHGQVPGLKAALTGLGYDASKLEVILVQIVNLSKDGEMVRMSKRLGNVVLLSELIDEVGINAVRYYLAASSADHAINFDLELAKKQSSENAVYYIQYAHARCAGIIRRATEGEKAILSQEQWMHYRQEYKNSAGVFEPLFSEETAVVAHQKALIALLADFPEVVVQAAQTRAVYLIAHYAYDVATQLQKVYETSPVLTANVEVTKARLGLIAATQQVLSNALGLLAIEAPERM